MKLTHPKSEAVVETNDPGIYLSQGWESVAERDEPTEPDDD